MLTLIGNGGYCRACYDFRRRYPAGRCTGCRHTVAIKKGYCRLCWLQAGAAAHGYRRIHPIHFTGCHYQQLVLAGVGRIGPCFRRGEPVPAPDPDPPARFVQLQLPLPGQSRRFDQAHWVASKITNPVLDRARRIAAHLAEVRGWNASIITQTNRALTVILTEHIPGEKIYWSDLPPALLCRDLSVSRITEILQLAGLLHDDRITDFQRWIDQHLAHLPALIASDVGSWVRLRYQGGPRSRPRHQDTVRQDLRLLHPWLLAWAERYHHLREVTADDIAETLTELSARRRFHTLTALRSLFGHLKKTGRIFRDPTKGIKNIRPDDGVIVPLDPSDIDQATGAATTPASRLILALAAVHAARPKAIREMLLNDIDLGNRRLIINGHRRPLDDLTHHLLLDWLDHRRKRWPHTANPHLIINKQTAMHTRPISENAATAAFRGLSATLEALRIDRQLDEALTVGPDPLHLAVVFNLSETTAIRYAQNARQIHITAAEEQDPASSPRTQRPNPSIQRKDP